MIRVFPNLNFLLNLFSKKPSLFPLIRSVDKWISSGGYPQRGKRGGKHGLIHAVSTGIVENKSLIDNTLFGFSTSVPPIHIFPVPTKMGMWEGRLAWRSYPRLSPLVLPCAGWRTTKKTCTPLIPVRLSTIPQVIPEITPSPK